MKSVKDVMRGMGRKIKEYMSFIIKIWKRKKIVLLAQAGRIGFWKPVRDLM